MDDSKATAAKARLREAIPHMRLAMELAQLEIPDGTVGLAVVVRDASGAGRVTAHFSGTEFLDDVEAVAGDTLAESDPRLLDPDLMPQGPTLGAKGGV